MKLRKLMNGVLACTMALSMVSVANAFEKNELTTAPASAVELLSKYPENLSFQDDSVIIQGESGDVVDLGYMKVSFSSAEFCKQMPEGTHTNGYTNINFNLSNVQIETYYMDVTNRHETDELNAYLIVHNPSDGNYYPDTKLNIVKNLKVTLEIQPRLITECTLALRSAAYSGKAIHAYVKGRLF